MGKSLVIVESPAKSKTISKFLGVNFVIKASMGHVIDLPKSQIGIDVENNFEAEYVVISGKKKILNELTSVAKKVDSIYLALDPDREGEAIAWHLANYIRENFKGDMYRVSFNEITKKAILGAVQNPGELDINLVNAQQARRALDRIVGYKVSPFLWKSVGRGLSAGRVQSVCVRLICEREQEIKAFIPEESWSIEAIMHRPDDTHMFHTQLEKMEGKKAEIKTEVEAHKVLADLEGVEYQIIEIKLKEKNRRPDAPFITSTLQQRASYKIRFSASKTMSIAQQLYEGIDIGHDETVGLITYMRTDSYRISDEAQDETKDYILDKFGKEYIPPKPHVFTKKKKKGKKNVAAQDAHEAIRSTSINYTPESMKEYLTEDQHKLYSLIWMQFLKSQMAEAVFDGTTVRVAAGDYIFKATGSVVKFPGDLAAEKEAMTEAEKEDAEHSHEDLDDKILPSLNKGESLLKEKLDAEQHFTKAPARYSEASLVKALEEHGIGRPSTYAPTIKTIQDRGYVERRDRRFFPTKLGVRVNDVLVQFLPDLFNVDFTAKMEEDLDAIADGEKDWVSLLKDFYGPFDKTLESAQEKMTELKQQVIETDEVCEKCDSPMIIKIGRFGQFMACSNYPECRNTKDLGEEGEEEEDPGEAPQCEICKTDMMIKMGRYGKFWACNAYPDCKVTKAITVSSGFKCPEEGCDGDLVQRRSRKRGRLFWGCSKYPECTHLTNELPSAEGESESESK